MMTFSDFIKILYSYIGNGQQIPDFIVDITNQIMEEPNTKNTVKQDKNGKYNPLSSKNSDMLYKIYQGKKALPKKDAQIILAHIDPDRFRCHLLHFPEKTINLIASELRDKNVKMNIDENGEEDIEATCAELFASIIEDCAKKTHVKHTSDQCLLPTLNTNSDIQLSIPNECKICLCCKNWKGNMQDAYNNTFGTLGRCQLHSKEILSTEGTNCTGFMPAYGHISHYQLMHKFPGLWKNL